jgi:deoxyxylulose-5-phosphate synthase
MDAALKFANDCQMPVAIRYPKEDVQDDILPGVFEQLMSLAKVLSSERAKAKSRLSPTAVPFLRR